MPRISLAMLLPPPGFTLSKAHACELLLTDSLSAAAHRLYRSGTASVSGRLEGSKANLVACALTSRLGSGSAVVRSGKPHLAILPVVAAMERMHTTSCGTSCLPKQARDLPLVQALPEESSAGANAADIQSQAPASFTAEVLQDMVDSAKAAVAQQQCNSPRTGAPQGSQSPITAQAIVDPQSPLLKQQAATGYKKTFYKRKLPSPPAIEFSSPEGRQLFAEALAEGHMTGFFKLMEQFR